MRTPARVTAFAVVAVLFLAGCGGDEPGATPPPPASPTSGGPAGDDAAPAAPGPGTAKALVEELRAQVKTVRLSVAYTAGTDPDDKLGRPGGYVSKAAFIDTRIDPDDVAGEKGDVRLGGGVEVYADPLDARARAEIISETLRSAGTLGSEYAVVAGGALLRVSGELTPRQWRAYEAAWPDVVGAVLGDA